jgi:hypothetical protein
MNRPKTLEERIAQRIARSKGEVFIRKDFADLADYDQVGRCLRHLASRGQLVKIGYGLYAKATMAPISKRPVPRRGIRDLAAEALGRLKVSTFPSSFEQDYNKQQTTQVPTGRVIGVKGRITRKIGYDGKYVTFERVH